MTGGWNSGGVERGGLKSEGASAGAKVSLSGFKVFNGC